MTKKLKIIVISIFSAITLFCAGFLICLQASSRTAFADEEKNFSFTTGAYSSYTYLEEDGKFNGWVMGFELNKLTQIYESVTDLTDGGTWEKNDPYLDYTFSVYRKNGEVNEKIYAYRIRFFGANDDKNVDVRIFRTKYIYTSAEISFSDERFEPLGGESQVLMEDGV